MIEKNIREDRLLKLKMISAIDFISKELTKKNLKFENVCGLFEVTICKNRIFMFQIDDGETITGCWINLYYDRTLDLCSVGFNLDEFVLQLDDIIKDVHDLYKIKRNVDKHIQEIKSTIRNSNLYGVKLSGLFDELYFENLIDADFN